MGSSDQSIYTTGDRIMHPAHRHPDRAKDAKDPVRYGPMNTADHGHVSAQRVPGRLSDRSDLAFT